MDKAAILADVYRRNALRRQAGLPLLDVRQEVNKATDLARLHEWYEFVDSKQADVEQIRSEVLAEYRAKIGPEFPNNSFSQMALERNTNRRFKAFAEAQYGVKAPDFS